MIGFGAQLSLHPPAEQFELVQRLEAVGYDSVWTGDHVSFHNPIHESITLLASYAPITKRIKLAKSGRPQRSFANRGLHAWIAEHNENRCKVLLRIVTRCTKRLHRAP